MTSGPSIALTSPPATAHPAAAAAVHSPRWISRTSSKQVLAGAHRVAEHHTGRAPIPARSESATDNARAPRRRGLIQDRRKSTPSTRASWLKARSRPGSGDHTAASSPEPIARAGDDVPAISLSASQQGLLANIGKARAPFVEGSFGRLSFVQRHTTAIYVARQKGTVAPEVRLALGPSSSLWCRGDIPTDARPGISG